MLLTKKKKHQEQRKRHRELLWSKVFVAYTNASNSKHKENAAGWADKAVEEFDKKFN